MGWDGFPFKIILLFKGYHVAMGSCSITMFCDGDVSRYPAMAIFHGRDVLGMRSSAMAMSTFDCSARDDFRDDDERLDLASAMAIYIFACCTDSVDTAMAMTQFVARWRYPRMFKYICTAVLWA